MTDERTEPPVGAVVDPTRSLAVLWRTNERRSRPGKPDLGIDRIAQAGIELADAAGLEALSMRKVADHLGVGTMSLYTYVPGKTELVDVMVDTVMAETVMAETAMERAAQPDDVPGGWRGGMHHVAAENFALYRRHPWLLERVSARPVLGPNVMAKYEHELRFLDGVGLTDIEMDSVLTLVLGHVEVSARRSLDVVRTAESSGMDDVTWWAVAAPFLERVVDGSRYPVSGRVGTAAGEAYNAASAPEHDLQFGLERILDGVETLLRSRA